jgi:hypothetical protein
MKYCRPWILPILVSGISSGVRRRVARVAPELGGAEVGRAPPAVGKRAVGEGRVERPDIEVLDAVPAVKVVERCPLAQRPAQQSSRVAARAARMPGEQPGLGLSR